MPWDEISTGALYRGESGRRSAGEVKGSASLCRLRRDRPLPDVTHLSKGEMGNVLLVEDNAPFRNWAKFVIERHGLVVVAARTAAEALQQAADKTIAIEVLVTDIYLPPTNGWELSKKVLDLWPAVRVLFMSAHALDDLRGQDMEIPENRFLRKPFQAEILLQKIDLLIDGPP